MPQTPSTRWCPTPEQLMILEEMYRSGVRTPNASQIQQITAHLSFYGKIEGKNVFYWFQNHKARDRQKLRRKLSRHHQLLIHGNPPTPSPSPSSSSSSSLQFHGSLEDQAACLSPTSAATYNQLFQHTTTPLGFLPQGVSDHQEAVHGMNLTCRLEKSGGSAQPINTIYGYNWMMMMESSSSNDAHDHQYYNPPKTLDLFPTKSTGLKDECATSKSSSGSTSSD